MTSPIEIAPSILSADYARLGEQVATAIDAGARRIHVDIMDGHFVPNLSFGPGTVSALAPIVHAAKGTVECHLMMTDPDRHLAGFARAGADVMTVHAEACCQLHRTISAVQATGSSAGVALNPATSPTAVEEILTGVDLILVMTVDPGFGGQELIPATLDKTRRIADLLASSGLTNVDLEVDGGIHEDTIGQALGAGATIAVAGSAIFSSARPVSACMTALRAAAARAAQARAGPGEQECPRLRSVKKTMTDQANRPAAKITGDLDRLCIDTIRTLSMDAVQAANSGHPGTPMALAPVAYCLWQRHLRFDPADPIWPDRDRFILSNGHASMLLYSLLHLTGVQAVNPKYEVTGKPAASLEDIKMFRQLGSHCPGHPEYRWTSGVETTTGPLGQGVATSVGMAAAGRWLAERYNKPGFRLFDFDVYALMGDGCMMEGISSEAASLAGHLRLDNLCWIYDNNHITIEGPTSLAFSEDVATRYQSSGWNVTRVGDANDLDMLSRAFDTFKATSGRPTLVIVDTHIGYGAPHKQDTPQAHGEPLGEEEVRAAKRFYGWPEDARFLVPEGVYEHFRAGIGQRGAAARKAWFELFETYREARPALAEEVYRMQHRQLPEGWDASLPVFPADPKGLASRESSGQVLNVLARNVPWLMGGAADLAPSTKTRLTFDGAGDFEAGSYHGRNFHFGIREHAMCAMANGMSLVKVRPFASTFLIFTDFARGAIRLSALMEIPVIYIWTHDSISVGEDGPTHQPIEQLASLRAMPGILVIRPADANEVTEAWRVILPLRHEPAVLVLSRQLLPTLDRTRYAPASGLARGGYVLADAPGGRPEVILIGTGSEVALCVAAHEALTAEGIAARVVSLPCWELFEHQDQAYRDQVLPPQVRARVTVEASSTYGWHRYAGTGGAILGMETFGASAPIQQIQAKFGFEPGHVIEAAKDQLARWRRE